LKLKNEVFVSQILKWGTDNLREFPWRRTNDPFEVLISEIFLQKTPAERVQKRFGDLVRAFRNPHLDVELLKLEFKDLGLTKRVEWLAKTIYIINKEFNGEVPKNPEVLRKLPGIGLYTANSITCIAYGCSIPMVDVNVVRNLSRVFDVPIAGRISQDSQIYRLASELVPEANSQIYNLSLIDHATIVCQKNPKCEICILSGICSWYLGIKSGLK